MIPFWNNDKKYSAENESDQSDREPGKDSMSQDASGSAEESEVTIPVPDVEAPFYGLKDNLAYFGFSQRGKSHIDSGTPCQDRCYSSYIPENKILIVAVADGVGSCALSDLGADTAVHSAVEYVHKELQQVDAKDLNRTLAGSVLRNALQYAYDQVELAAQAYEQLLYSLQSTLTVAIYNGTDLYFGHVGDDGIVVLTEEGTLAMATSRHKGEEASSVYPLQSKSVWQFGMVPNAVAFVVATDGVLDAFVRSSFEKNRVYYPFIEPVFTAAYENEKSVKRACADFFVYMSGDQYRAAVTDDLTIAVAMNIAKLPLCLPKFDLDAWNEETRRYEDKVRSALYEQPQKLSHGQADKPGLSDPFAQARETVSDQTEQTGQGNTDMDYQVPAFLQKRRTPLDTQAGQPRQLTPHLSEQEEDFRRNPGPDSRGRRRRSAFQAPYRKSRASRAADYGSAEATYRAEGYQEVSSRGEYAFRYSQRAQNPNGRYGGKTPRRARPVNRKKIRLQLITFAMILAFVLALFVYVGVCVSILFAWL